MSKKINFTIPINSLGFGIFSMSYLKILLKNTNLDISLFNISLNDDVSNVCTDYNLEVDHLDELLKKPYHKDTLDFIIWHPPSIKDYMKTNPAIGFTHFETTTLRARDIVNMKVPNLKKVLVTNQWAKNILESYDINSDVIPGPALPLYGSIKESNLSFNFRTSDETVFLSSGKWEKRKGHHILVEAFSKLSTQATLVGLWDNVFLNNTAPALNCIRSNGFTLKTYMKVAKNVLCYVYQNNLGNKIIAVSRLPKFNDIVYFYKNVDCFVNCSAGEGWNLPLVEAMSMGVPVISTDNTAQAEYINTNNSLVLHTTKEEVANDGIWFKGDVGFWYPTNVEDVLKNLLKVCDLRESSSPTLSKLARKGQSTIKDLCNAKNIAKQLLNILI